MNTTQELEIIQDQIIQKYIENEQINDAIDAILTILHGKVKNSTVN